MGRGELCFLLSATGVTGGGVMVVEAIGLRNEVFSFGMVLVTGLYMFGHQK